MFSTKYDLVRNSFNALMDRPLMAFSFWMSGDGYFDANNHAIYNSATWIYTMRPYEVVFDARNFNGQSRLQYSIQLISNDQNNWILTGVRDDVVQLLDGQDIATLWTGNDTARIRTTYDGDASNTFNTKVIIDGGDGLDGLDLTELRLTDPSDPFRGVTIRLSQGTVFYGAQRVATIKNFESVKGTEKEDLLVGTDGDDVLRGGDGSDVLNGGAGEDTLYGGAGNDVFQIDSTYDGQLQDGSNFKQIYGETGSDTVDASKAVLTGQADSDKGLMIELRDRPINFISYKNQLVAALTSVESAIGTAKNDSILGNASNSWLRGGAGDDFLDGGDGVDRLDGNSGDDEIVVSSAYDGLPWNSSNQKDINGGSGTDTLDFSGVKLLDTLRPDDGLSLHLGKGFIDYGVQRTVTFSGIEKVVGSTKNDTFLFDSTYNGEFRPKNKMDVDGGAGIDVVDFSKSNLTGGYPYEGVDIYLENEEIQYLGGTVATVRNVENVVGTGRDDWFTGTTGNDAFWDGMGSDSINGGGGNDEFFTYVGQDPIGSNPYDHFAGEGSHTIHIKIVKEVASIEKYKSKVFGNLYFIYNNSEYELKSIQSTVESIYIEYYEGAEEHYTWHELFG